MAIPSLHPKPPSSSALSTCRPHHSISRHPLQEWSVQSSHSLIPARRADRPHEHSKSGLSNHHTPSFHQGTLTAPTKRSVRLPSPARMSPCIPARIAPRSLCKRSVSLRTNHPDCSCKRSVSLRPHPDSPQRSELLFRFSRPTRPRPHASSGLANPQR
jgi:hypothetical protein